MLSHIVLRRAAIDALCPAGVTTGPWPTIAADRVFDSAISPIDSLVGREAKPVVCLYTEEVDASSGSSTNGVPHQPVVTLVVEVGARAFVPTEVEGGQTVLDLLAPVSDGALEAATDVLASQVYRRLVLEPPEAFRRARRQCSKFTSTPFRDGEGGQKLAIRALSLSIALHGVSTLEDEISVAEAVLSLLPVGSDGAAIVANAIASLQAGSAAVAPSPAVSTANPPASPGADLIIRPFDAQPGAQDVVASLPLTPP